MNEITLVHVVLDYKCKLKVRINWEQVLNIIQSSFFSRERLKINLPSKTIYQWLLDEFVKYKDQNIGKHGYIGNWILRKYRKYRKISVDILTKISVMEKLTKIL